jgi:hypothetical protein
VYFVRRSLIPVLIDPGSTVVSQTLNGEYSCRAVTFQCALVSTRSVVPPCGGTVPVLPAIAVPG